MKSQKRALFNCNYYILLFGIPLFTTLTVLVYVLVIGLSDGETIFYNTGVMVFAGVALLMAVVIPIVNIVTFILDRKTLKSAELYYPHWGWFFMQPVYVWKRNYHNGISAKWFWVYIIVNFLYPEIILALIPG